MDTISVYKADTRKTVCNVIQETIKSTSDELGVKVDGVDVIEPKDESLRNASGNLRNLQGDDGVSVFMVDISEKKLVETIKAVESDDPDIKENGVMELRGILAHEVYHIRGGTTLSRGYRQDKLNEYPKSGEFGFFRTLVNEVKRFSAREEIAAELFAQKYIEGLQYNPIQSKSRESFEKAKGNKLHLSQVRVSTIRFVRRFMGK